MAEKRKLDTRALGLDVGLAFSRFLTGKENLHYGLWDAEWDVCAANMGRAQEAYTDKLFRMLPEGENLQILDIGGGAGETARKLLAMGHQVEIVIPSTFLAERCRKNATGALVHECRFEDFQSEKRFDLCLFSESFQYIPLSHSLGKCLTLLNKTGRIIVADCFRTDAYFSDHSDLAKVGGGHALTDFRALLADLPLRVEVEVDVTEAVAPSVEVEQELFNVIGYAIRRADEGLGAAHPLLTKGMRGIVRLMLNRRRRDRLDQRLNQNTRSAKNFQRYNTYLMLKLAPKS
ncbi:MAG: methyltransferase domain-containing protein [Rhodobacteraceae bacterium]|nr:methyltransferase domain-containing protein [Paracoccaceae bacterium]